MDGCSRLRELTLELPVFGARQDALAGEFLALKQAHRKDNEVRRAVHAAGRTPPAR